MSAPQGAGLAGQIDGYLQKYGSPMAGLGSVFVAAGKKYGVDPRLPAAISIAESSGGKHVLGSYNAWGWGPGIPFGSWQEGISKVTQGLASGYINQGLRTPLQIANKWAPASAGNDPTHWAGTVSDVMRAMGATVPALATSTPATATTPARTMASAKISAPPTQTVTQGDLQQMIDQYSMPLTPSTYGLQNALFENLDQISQTGKTDGTSSLSNMLGGLQQDAYMDAVNQNQQSSMVNLLQSLKGSLPTDSSGAPSTPATRDEPNKTPADIAAQPPQSSPVQQPSSQGGGFLPKGASYTQKRADQGRDLLTDPGGAIIAPGNGYVIRNGYDPHGFGTSYPIVHFTDGPYAGQDMYIGHTQSQLGAGAKFSAGQVLSYTGKTGTESWNGNADQAGWAEIGFAPGGTPGKFGQRTPFA